MPCTGFSLRGVGVGVGGEEGVILKCTVVSWPNLDWQQTADFSYSVSVLSVSGQTRVEKLRESRNKVE